MADDTAKLVLSLEARFDKFEKSMKDATKVVDQQTKLIEQRFTDMTKVISNKLDGIKGAFIGQAGTLGSALAALGPIGVGAAVGIGALVEALNLTAAAAERVGQKALAIRSFSLSTGFSVEETQGIRKAVTGLGLDFEQVQNAIARFTSELHELQATGGGPLVKALQSVDSGLVNMMINARSTKEAFDILINALGKMDTAQRNAFARSIAGKGSLGVIAEITADLEKFNKLMAEGISGAKTAKELDVVVKAMRDMIAAQSRAANEWDKMFPTTRFMQQKTEEYNRLTAVMEQFNKQGTLANTIAQTAQTQAESRGTIGPAVGPALVARIAQTLGLIKPPAPLPPPALTGTVTGGAVPVEATKTADLEAVNKLRDYGIRQLNTQVRLLEDIKEAQGELTPLQAKELANLQAQVKLAQQVNPDPAVQQAYTNGIKLRNDAFSLLTITMKEQLGVATEQEIKDAKLIVINRALSNQIITGAQAQAAALIAAKEAKEKYDAQLVRASALPGLQRTALDLNNAAKQIDQLGGKALEAFSDNMADAILGTKTFADAFKSMSNIILKEMIKISIQKALIGPLLSGLTGITAIAGKMSGGPVMAGTPYIVGERGPEIMVPNTNGNILPNSALQSGGGSIIYSPKIDARGASVEAVARLAQIVEQDRAAFASKTVATIQQARRNRVVGL